MKNTITGIIGIAAISVGFMSVADASERQRGNYSEKRIVKKVRHDDERRWKYRDDSPRLHRDHVYTYPEKRFRRIEKQRRHDKHHRGHRYVEKHVYKHKKRRYVEKHVYKHHGRRYVEKHVYHHRKPRRVEKHVYHHRAPRRVEKHVYHHYDHAPRHRIVKKVIIRDRHHHDSALPAIAGGLIGSAIGNDLGHGDPVVTFSSAILGAMVGEALSHH